MNNAPSGIHAYPAIYQAVVVETNDPLQMHRVRIKCPMLHDESLRPEECPWAVCLQSLGGRRSGSWESLCIGDWVWVSFDKGHTYGPVVIGGFVPTRRKHYPLPAIYGESPLPVDEEGKVAKIPQDGDSDFYTNDRRPMSRGIVDHYGNMDVFSAVGFFPKRHEQTAPDSDYDALSKANYKLSGDDPKLNEPDAKYMLRMSKYGHMLLLGDQGYHWKKEGSMGEFVGDENEDEQYEIDRWKFLQKLINEGEAKPDDQRRILMQTRYGHKLEMRDVGWAQNGPMSSKSRDEYGEPSTLSRESEKDQRWIKLRSKGGMLLQLSDMGLDPDSDEFVKRSLLEEVGDKADGESDWQGRDARWIRIASRHGYKFVIDDRGSDQVSSHDKENPRGNGILIKGRRSPGAGDDSPDGDPRGFFWEFNENDGLNQTSWGSPSGQIVQISDRHQYIMLASRVADLPSKYEGLKEHEFMRKPLVMDDKEESSHHLKIDLSNEYLRFKSRSGKGDAPLGQPADTPGVKGDINQGLEIRDGSKDDSPWVELVDSDDRNFWLWSKMGVIMCHAKRKPEPTEMMWWMNEQNNEIVIRNDESGGRIQIYSSSPIEIYGTDDVNISAGRRLSLSASESVTIGSGDNKMKFSSDGVGFNGTLRGPRVESYFPGVMPGPGAGQPKTPNVQLMDVPQPATTPKLSPGDRGKRHNVDLEREIDVDEIEHKT